MRTLAQSASSSSARMSGSDVSDPCPISAAGDMIATVSSVEIVTHGLSATSPLRAASARRPDAIVKVKPAAPTMKVRRLPAIFSNAVVMGSALLHDALDGADDARIGAAATDIGAHMVDDLRAAGLRVACQQIGRAHDLAGLTVAALRHPLGEPGLLHRMRGVGRKPLDGGDRLAGDLADLGLARELAPAVDVHHAGAAQAG